MRSGVFVARWRSSCMAASQPSAVAASCAPPGAAPRPAISSVAPKPAIGAAPGADAFFVVRVAWCRAGADDPEPVRMTFDARPDAVRAPRRRAARRRRTARGCGRA